VATSIAQHHLNLEVAVANPRLPAMMGTAVLARPAKRLAAHIGDSDARPIACAPVARQLFNDVGGSMSPRQKKTQQDARARQSTFSAPPPNFRRPISNVPSPRMYVCKHLAFQKLTVVRGRGANGNVECATPKTTASILRIAETKTLNKHRIAKLLRKNDEPSPGNSATSTRFFCFCSSKG
jgi:hypothetical protein